MLACDGAFFVAAVVTCNALLAAGIAAAWAAYSVSAVALVFRVVHYYAYVRSVLLYTNVDTRRNTRQLPLPTSDVRSALAIMLYSGVLVTVTRADPAHAHAVLWVVYAGVACVHLGYLLAADDRPALREFVRTYLEARIDPPARIVTWSGTQTLHDMTATLESDDDSDSLISVQLDDGVADSLRTELLDAIKSD